MIKFESVVKGIFEKIIKNYNLTLVSMDESEVFLVGKGFAFSICFNREGVDIYYIMSNGNDGLVVYPISNSLQDRFTLEDRAHYGNPFTNEERVISELKVYASGVLNHWGDLLSGDKTWFKKHQGKGIKANSYVKSILAPILTN